MDPNVLSDQKTWSTWITNPRTIAGTVNDALQITARVSAERGELAIAAQATVIVDCTLPVLSLSTPHEMTEPVVNSKATLQLPGRGIAAMDTLPSNDWRLNKQWQSITLPTSNGFTPLM